MEEESLREHVSATPNFTVRTNDFTDFMISGNHRSNSHQRSNRQSFLSRGETREDIRKNVENQSIRFFCSNEYQNDSWATTVCRFVDRSLGLRSNISRVRFLLHPYPLYPLYTLTFFPRVYFREPMAISRGTSRTRSIVAY